LKGIIPNPSPTDFYVHLNIARYVFSRSKHFEQPRKRLALAGGGLTLRSREASQTCGAVRFSEEEHNRFLSMFEKSGVYAKSVFLKAHFFGQPFKVLKVDKTLVDYYTKLSDFHAQFRAIGTNYNQVVKELRLHFSEKKAMALLYKLEQQTVELVKLSRKIVELSREMQEKWSQKSV